MRKLFILSAIAFCLSAALKVNASPPAPDVGNVLVVDDAKPSFNVNVSNFTLESIEYSVTADQEKVYVSYTPVATENLKVNNILAYPDNPVSCYSRIYSLYKFERFSEKIFLANCSIRQCITRTVFDRSFVPPNLI